MDRLNALQVTGIVSLLLQSQTSPDIHCIIDDKKVYFNPLPHPNTDGDGDGGDDENKFRNAINQHVLQIIASLRSRDSALTTPSLPTRSPCAS